MRPRICPSRSLNSTTSTISTSRVPSRSVHSINVFCKFSREVSLLRVPFLATAPPGLCWLPGAHSSTPARLAAVVTNFGKFRQNFVRFRLYRHRSLQGNTRSAAFFKIYQIFWLKILKFGKILQFLRHLQNFCWIFQKLLIFQTDFLRKFWDCSSAKGCKSCRAWKMLSNAYFLAKFRFDTAENEPAKICQFC